MLEAQEELRTLPFAGWSPCCRQHLPTASSVCPLPGTCLLGSRYACLLRSAQLIVLASLNLLRCRLQALPLAVSSSQWVWAQLLGECPLFSQASPGPCVSLVSPTAAAPHTAQAFIAVSWAAVLCMCILSFSSSDPQMFLRSEPINSKQTSNQVPCACPNYAKYSSSVCGTL